MSPEARSISSPNHPNQRPCAASIFPSFLALLLLAGVPCDLGGDTIVLKNGRRIYAAAVSEEGSTLFYEGENGRVGIPKSLVERVEEGGVAPAFRPSSSSAARPPSAEEEEFSKELARRLEQPRGDDERIVREGAGPARVGRDFPAGGGADHQQRLGGALPGPFSRNRTGEPVRASGREGHLSQGRDGGLRVLYRGRGGGQVARDGRPSAPTRAASGSSRTRWGGFAKSCTGPRRCLKNPAPGGAARRFQNDLEGLLRAAGTVAEKNLCSEGSTGGKRVYTLNCQRAKKLIPADRMELCFCIS